MATSCYLQGNILSGQYLPTTEMYKSYVPSVNNTSYIPVQKCAEDYNYSRHPMPYSQPCNTVISYSHVENYTDVPQLIPRIRGSWHDIKEEELQCRKNKPTHGANISVSIVVSLSIKLPVTVYKEGIMTGKLHVKEIIFVLMTRLVLVFTLDVLSGLLLSCVSRIKYSDNSSKIHYLYLLC